MWEAQVFELVPSKKKKVTIFSSGPILFIIQRNVTCVVVLTSGYKNNKYILHVLSVYFSACFYKRSITPPQNTTKLICSNFGTYN